MVGEFNSLCPRCQGSGETVAPVLAFSAQSSHPSQLCNQCNGRGALIGVPATLKDYRDYFDEPCSVTDEIFSLARQIQESQGSLDNRGEIELGRFYTHSHVPDGTGTLFELGAYIPVLMPDGDLAIRHRDTGEFTNPAIKVWDHLHDDTGWHLLPLSSLSDLLVLFDFRVSGHAETRNFQLIPPDRPSYLDYLEWSLERYYEKGHGLLTTLQDIQQGIVEGKTPPLFLMQNEKPIPLAETPPVVASYKNNTTGSPPTPRRSPIRAFLTPRFSIANPLIALLTFVGFISTYYAAHFFTHMWEVPWGTAEAVWFAAASADLLEYSLWTAGAWAIVSGIFPHWPGITLLATAHAVQSGVAQPEVFLIPPLFPAPGWVSAVLEAVTVSVNEWLFFTSIIALVLALTLMIYAAVIRQEYS